MGRDRLPVANVLSVARPGLALVFASIAFQSVPSGLLTGIYVAAAASDLIDGYVARRFGVASYFGTVLDLIGDKSLTLVSVIYAGIRGVPMFPLAVIATREIVVLGMRLVSVEGSQLLPTSRMFGGTMAAALWGVTAYLVAASPSSNAIILATYSYSGIAAVYAINLGWRIHAGRRRITASLSKPQR
jgi:phosphatidylglycerophosphate synthase